MLLWILALLFLLLALYLIGPMADRAHEMKALDTPADITRLEPYLAQKEAQFSLMPNVNKQISWHNNQKQPTDYSLLVFHGFSSTRHELAPLPSLISQANELNRFDTRFYGHGVNDQGHSLAQARFQDWITDAQEACEIGRVIGRRSFILACSTGAGAAMWAAQTYPQQIAGLILVAPNFTLTNRFAPLLPLPWGAQLVDLLMAPTRSYHGEPWWDQKTHDFGRQVNFSHFPQRAIIPMGVSVHYAIRQRFSQMQIPLLVILDDKDKLVRSDVTRNKVFARWGSPHKTLLEYPAMPPAYHLPFGDFGAPQNNDRALIDISDFIQSVIAREQAQG